MTSENPDSKDGFSFFREASLPIANALTMFNGVLITLLGFLILLMTLGIIPLINVDGQLGLLLVFTSLQMLALGQVVGSQVTRSWLLMTIGIVFAGMGIFSCIVPGILTDMLRMLLGLQNIITGVLVLATQLLVPTLHGIRSPPTKPVTLPPIIKRLLVIVTATSIVAILFGINMLAPLLLPSLLGLVVYALLLPVLVMILGLLALSTVYISQKLQ